MSDSFTLTDSYDVVLDDFPYNWVPSLEFFDSEIPGFPLYRVHFKHNGNRVFGVPVNKYVEEKNGDGTCKLAVEVIANHDLTNLASNEQQRVKTELKERFGLSEALTKSDILSYCECEGGCSCQTHQDWKEIVEIIYPRLEEYYGDRLPCGRFHEQTYGIFRQAATWNVPGGGKQELIMTSDLLQTVGEDVDNSEGWQVNLHLLPTYEEILTNNLDDFPAFQKLKEAVEDFGDQHLTDQYEVNNDLAFHRLDPDKDVPGGRYGRENWNTLMETVDENHRRLLVQLKEDLNRMYQRPYVLIVYVYNILNGLDFNDFDQDAYVQIYRDDPRSTYPKVLGMLLQQVFAKYDCIPVDTWVETFFEILLDTDSDEIPESGQQLGKFERFVWETVQLRKTNQPLFDDIVQCIKTGVLKSDTMYMRHPNPLSCSLCSLKNEGCPVYESIDAQKVAVVERDTLESQSGANQILLKTRAKTIDDYDPKLYLDSGFFDSHDLQNIEFIVLSEDDEAEAVYIPARKDKQKWHRTDDMSPFTTYIPLSEGFYTVSEIAER